MAPFGTLPDRGATAVGGGDDRRPCRSTPVEGLAAQARFAPDPEATLNRAIFFAVTYRRPDEHHADDHERQREKHYENHDRDGVHRLSLPRLGPYPGSGLLASRGLGGRLASTRSLTHQSQRRNSADQHNPTADQQHIIEGTDE